MKMLSFNFDFSKWLSLVTLIAFLVISNIVTSFASTEEQGSNKATVQYVDPGGIVITANDMTLNYFKFEQPIYGYCYDAKVVSDISPITVTAIDNYQLSTIADAYDYLNTADRIQTYSLNGRISWNVSPTNLEGL